MATGPFARHWTSRVSIITRGQQFLHYGGVDLGQIAFVDSGACRGAHSPRGKQILERDGNAVKRAAIFAVGELTVRLPRLLQRLPGGDRDERAQGGVVPVDEI